jgi:DNA-binding MarR family transcriptional regulator
MPHQQALDPDEELLWRSLLRIVVALPRSLDDDLVRATGVSLTEYIVLMNLSEAPNRPMRVRELAGVMGLSASRVSRLADQLASRGLAHKTRSPDDGRGYIVVITDEGLHRLQRAYPAHLASARRRVFDRLMPADVPQIAQALSLLAGQFWSHGRRQSKVNSMLLKASYSVIMTEPPPLTPSEEVLWRALNRIMVALPRALDSDLIHATGLTLNEYATLMFLSEAPNQELRMADLAAATALSASRITRLVEGLQARDLVTKRPSPEDGRGNTARPTPQGLAKLKSAYAAHLSSARHRVIDHVDAAALGQTARALESVAKLLAD